MDEQAAKEEYHFVGTLRAYMSFGPKALQKGCLFYFAIFTKIISFMKFLLNPYYLSMLCGKIKAMWNFFTKVSS
jgi:Na+/serine symporter